MSVTGGSATAHALLGTAADGPVEPSRLPAREAAERELSKPMYHENDPNLLRRAMNRFWDWVGDLLTSVAGAAPGGTLGLIVILLLVAALVAALWWRLGKPRRTPHRPGSLFDDRPRSAAEHRAAADRHAAKERWNEALQERMRAVVRSLEERTLLDPHPGRTADEAAHEAGRTLPAQATRLRSAAREFDDVTYGGRTTDPQAYQRLRELDLDLEQATPPLSDAAGGTAP
ncbi:DUF4129 domain-containing protein [Streptomyces liangshanensis]|uniref:DUF4129 domain-containing protein n=1 Tax=Streptomyces liangshanensis TaxID=2717324 RepID=UPI0036DF9E22